MHRRLYDDSKKTHAAERRLKTLATHLEQAEILKQHKAVYQKHQQLPPKKRDAFYDKHAEGIQRYEAAKRHFDACMNGRRFCP